MSDKDAREEVLSRLRNFEIRICDGCIKMAGRMCHTAGCVFFLCDMEEVGQYLDRLLIRPVINGKRYEGAMCEIARG